jgi:hypothetical protein
LSHRPAITLGVFSKLQSLFPGSTRSGAAAKRNFLSLFDSTLDLMKVLNVPGYEVLSFTISVPEVANWLINFVADSK